MRKVDETWISYTGEYGLMLPREHRFVGIFPTPHSDFCDGGFKVVFEVTLESSPLIPYNLKVGYPGDLMPNRWTLLGLASVQDQQVAVWMET